MTHVHKASRDHRRRLGQEAIRPDQLDNLELWLDASTLTGLANGDPVPTWPDQSANGNDATQSTADDQPAYLIDQVNGLPSIHFDGINEYMPLDSLITLTAGWTFVLIERPAIYGASSHQFGYDINNNGGWIRHDQADKLGFRWEATSTYMTHGFTISKTEHQISIIVHETSGLTTYYHNGATGAGAFTRTGTFALDVIARKDGERNFEGRMAEIIIYSAGLSPTQRKGLEKYLSQKYAIGLA